MSFEFEKDKFLVDWDYRNYSKYNDFKSLLNIARKYHIKLDFGRLEDYDISIDSSNGFKIKVRDNSTNQYQEISCYEDSSKNGLGYCIDTLECNSNYRLERKYFSSNVHPYKESLTFFNEEYKFSFDKQYSNNRYSFKIGTSLLEEEEPLFEYSLFRNGTDYLKIRKYEGLCDSESVLIRAFDDLDIEDIKDKFVANKDLYFSVLRHELEKMEISDVKKKVLVNNS